jgi:hypothetical protein
MFFSERYNIRMLQNHRTYIKPQLCTVNKGCARTVPVYFRFFVAKKYPFRAAHRTQSSWRFSCNVDLLRGGFFSAAHRYQVSYSRSFA